MNATKKQMEKNPAWSSHLNNWGIYAAAAGASLSMATNADASIIHQTVDFTASLTRLTGNVNTHKTVQFNLFGAPVDLVVQNNAPHTSRSTTGAHSTLHTGSRTHFFPRAGNVVLGALGNGEQVRFFDSGFNDRVKKYAPGAAIGGNLNHTNFSQNDTAFPLTVQGGVRHGAFAPNDSGFVGFKGVNGDLGWMRIVISDRNSDGYPDQIELVDYAYNSVSGAAINAGDTGSIPSSPEPGSASLAILAAGAAGIVALRRARARKEVSAE